MKKWSYLVSGMLIGAIVATSGSAVAAQVKSLIGQKVTGELTVVVNGQELADKGAVINGRTNVPVRALIDAVGGELQLKGKVITITTNGTTEHSDFDPVNGPVATDNEYIGQPKESLERIKESLENDILTPTLRGRENLQVKLNEAQKGTDKELIDSIQEKIINYDADIEKYTKQLEQVNEALEALK